jgi:Uma2 family endonuclease
MALQHRQEAFITEAEYLAGELLSAVKHEYIDGQVYAMAGVSKNHDRIAANISRHFGNHLQSTPCDVFSSDVKVKAGSDFFYPDAMVVCDDMTEHEYYSESPVLIVEVLSKSTRRKDRTLKKRAYQSIPSLKEYVLIEQDFAAVEVCRRDRGWQSEHFFLGDEADFQSIGLRLLVEAIYARVENEDMREFLAGREAAASPPEPVADEPL